MVLGMNAISELLLERREEAALSQRAVARKLGVSPQTYVWWEGEGRTDKLSRGPLAHRVELRTFNPAGRVRDPGGPQRSGTLLGVDSSCIWLRGRRLRIFCLTSDPFRALEAEPDRCGTPDHEEAR